MTYVGRCDNIIKSRATRTRQAAVAQAVERRIGSAEVTGPIPVSSLRKSGSFWVSKVSAFLLCLSIKKYYNIYDVSCIFVLDNGWEYLITIISLTIFNNYKKQTYESKKTCKKSIGYSVVEYAMLNRLAQGHQISGTVIDGTGRTYYRCKRIGSRYDQRCNYRYWR